VLLFLAILIARPQNEDRGEAVSMGTTRGEVETSTAPGALDDAPPQQQVTPPAQPQTAR
jgi:hypothetical protein